MKRMKKIASIKSYQLPINIKQDGEYFIATCPLWHDCYAQGKTIDEATSEIIGVATSLVELYAEEGIFIPLTERKLSNSPKRSKISFNVPVFASS